MKQKDEERCGAKLSEPTNPCRVWSFSSNLLPLGAFSLFILGKNVQLPVFKKNSL